MVNDTHTRRRRRSVVDEVMPDRCSIFKDWADYCGTEMEKLVLLNSSSLNSSLKLFQKIRAVY